MSSPPLAPAAIALRVFHVGVAVVEVASLGYVWSCALTRRRDRVLAIASIALAVEGSALVVGRGNCPLAPLQQRLGDPVPLFELVLEPRAAKAAVPALAGLSAVGLALAWARPSRPAAGHHHRLDWVAVLNSMLAGSKVPRT